LGWLARPVLRLRSAAEAGTAEEGLTEAVEAAAFTGAVVVEDFTEAVEECAATDRLGAVEDRLAAREVDRLEDRSEEREVDRLARGAEAVAWVRHRAGDSAAVRAVGILARVLADQRDRTLR